MHRYCIGTERDTQVAQNMVKDVLDRGIGDSKFNHFIRDWMVRMQFSDKATRRDITIDNLLHGTDDEVEEFIEVAYQMTDRSFHSVRLTKKQLDDYVPV